MSDAVSQSAALQEIEKYPHGAFSWLELNTTDQEKATQFYTELFGWTYDNSPLGDGTHYTMLRLNGKDVAAINPMREEQQAGGPPYWGSYITVDSVDETTAQVEAAGGVVLLQPFDVMEHGRMSAIQDSTGAVISLWEPRKFAGSRYVIAWNELMTRDVPAAFDFYKTLLGWTGGLIEFGGRQLAALHNQERPVAMIVPMGPEMSDAPPHWAVYFAVPDFDAALAKAQELGGTLLGDAQQHEGTRYAALQDPQGAIFYIMSMGG